MRTLPLILLAAALATGTVAAQQAPSSDSTPLSSERADKAGTSVGDRPPFDELDADDDGFLSKTELKHDNEFLARFARWDIDSDKRLSVAEYHATAIVDAE